MRPKPLWKLAVTTTGEAEDAVAALLERLSGQSPSVFVSAQTQAHVLSLFLEDPGAFGTTRRQELRRGLAHIRGCGLDTGPVRIRFRKMPAEDWAEAWKRHFRPIEIGAALLLRPSWSRRQARADQAVVTLDPGMSFGTGQHPTTAFCLRQLVAWRKPGQAQSLLDVGTGSGILAIAAGKLGYRPVVGYDVDPAAIRVAKTNGEANGVRQWIRFERLALERLPFPGPKYDVICANLTDDLLLAHARRLRARLQPGGVLVLAGILASRFLMVRRHFEKSGLRLRSREAKTGWESGTFVLEPGSRARRQPPAPG